MKENKKNLTQRVLAMALALVMCFGMLTVGALAAEVEEPALDEAAAAVAAVVDTDGAEEVRATVQVEEPAGVDEPVDVDDPAQVEDPAGAEEPVEVKEPAGAEEPVEVDEPAEVDEPVEVKEPAGAVVEEVKTEAEAVAAALAAAFTEETPAPAREKAQLADAVYAEIKKFVKVYYTDDPYTLDDMVESKLNGTDTFTAINGNPLSSGYGSWDVSDKDGYSFDRCDHADAAGNFIGITSDTDTITSYFKKTSVPAVSYTLTLKHVLTQWAIVDVEGVPKAKEISEELKTEKISFKAGESLASKMFWLEDIIEDADYIHTTEADDDVHNLYGTLTAEHNGTDITLHYGPRTPLATVDIAVKHVFMDRTCVVDIEDGQYTGSHMEFTPVDDLAVRTTCNLYAGEQFSGDLQSKVNYTFDHAEDANGEAVELPFIASDTKGYALTYYYYSPVQDTRIPGSLTVNRTYAARVDGSDALTEEGTDRYTVDNKLAGDKVDFLSEVEFGGKTYSLVSPAFAIVQPGATSVDITYVRVITPVEYVIRHVYNITDWDGSVDNSARDVAQGTGFPEAALTIADSLKASLKDACQLVSATFNGAALALDAGSVTLADGDNEIVFTFAGAIDSRKDASVTVTYNYYVYDSYTGQTTLERTVTETSTTTRTDGKVDQGSVYAGLIFAPDTTRTSVDGRTYTLKSADPALMLGEAPAALTVNFERTVSSRPTGGSGSSGGSTGGGSTQTPGGNTNDDPADNPGETPNGGNGGNTQTPGDNSGETPAENPGENPGETPGENPEAPVETPEAPAETPEEVVTLPDEDVPLGELPDLPPEPLEELDDEDVPLDELPDELTEVDPEQDSATKAPAAGANAVIQTPAGTVVLEDEDVPLASVPQTGDLTALWLAAAAMSGIGVAGLGLKKKDREE